MNRYVVAILFLSVMVVVTDARGAFLRATDKFATGDGTGTVGANLNGTAVEDGDVSWIAESTIKFQSGDFIQRVGSAGNNVAIVPVTPGGNARYTVSARILPADSTFPTFFTGLGFTDNVDLEPFWAPGGGGSLWMWLSPQGGYEILAKDTAIHILSNTGPNAAPGFVPGGFNELKLTYDPATNVVNAFVNGTQVVTNFDLDPHGYTPPLGAAGIFFLGDQSAADDFVAIVPEPAMMGMLGLGLVFLRRRRFV